MRCRRYFVDKLHATEPGVRQVVRYLAEAGEFEGREFMRFLSLSPILQCYAFPFLPQAPTSSCRTAACWPMPRQNLRNNFLCSTRIILLKLLVLDFVFACWSYNHMCIPPSAVLPRAGPTVTGGQLLVTSWGGVVGSHDSVTFKPAGGAAFNEDWGREYCFQKILEDLWDSGHQFKTVALIYAGNDLGRIDNQSLAGLIAAMSNWATNHQVVVRLVDIVGCTYLPNP